MVPSEIEERPSALGHKINVSILRQTTQDNARNHNTRRNKTQERLRFSSFGLYSVCYRHSCINRTKSNLQITRKKAKERKWTALTVDKWLSLFGLFIQNQRNPFAKKVATELCTLKWRTKGKHVMSLNNSTRQVWHELIPFVPRDLSGRHHRINYRICGMRLSHTDAVLRPFHWSSPNTKWTQTLLRVTSRIDSTVQKHQLGEALWKFPFHCYSPTANSAPHPLLMLGRFTSFFLE